MLLEPREIQLIRMYALAPALAAGCLGAAAVSVGAGLALCAADAVFFYARDAYFPGIATAFVMAVVLGTIGVTLVVVNRRRDYDPAWLDLCDKTLRAGPFSPNAGPSLQPMVVARFHEVPVIPVSAVAAGAILLPPAILLSLFLPHYRAQARALEESRQLATAGLESVAETLEDGGCTDVWYSDPNDYHAYYGYTVSGYLQGGEEDVFITPETVKLSAVVDNHGQIIEVSYIVGVDIQLSQEDNLKRVRTRLEKGNSVLRGITVPVKSGDLYTPELLPDYFLEKWPGAYPYENTYTWYEADDGVVVSADYCTYPEEEYGEYDSAYVRVSVTCPDAWE